MKNDNSPMIKSYVIRKTRMSNAQKQAYERHYQRWVIKPENPIDWDNLFPDASRRVVEIGFGMGDATSQVALAHPDWGILAVDVHKPGIGKLLCLIERDKIDNIRIAEQDAVHLVCSCLSEASVDAFHVWFPDPWPKKRHHKRRLLQKSFLLEILRVLKPGGILHAVTDWEEYAMQILDNLNTMAGWRNGFDSWAPKPDYRPETKFERRGLQSEHCIRDIVFLKEFI